MITVRDLAKKLAKYPDQDTEVMLEYDGGIAFPFLDGQDNTALGLDNMTKHKFLVFRPDLKGKRLHLKGNG